MLFYLLSFVLFAVIRIATGVSIQRIGYLCLRRISYTPRDGTRIDIRGLSLHLHRPTFARPTWVSLRLTELKVTLDFQTSRVETVDRDAEQRATNEPAQGQEYSPAPLETPTERLESRPGTLRGQTWRNLTRTKERIKALHEKINWLRMIDLEVLSSSCEVSGVGSFQIASFTVAVDTRRKTVDRGRLFRHKKIPERGQQPAEWMLVLKSILFTAEGKESLEILDICSLNVHGLLYKGLAGLRDVSVSLKLGRIHVPYDDLMGCLSTIENQRKAHRPRDEKKISFSDMIKEFDMPGSREERIVQAVSDSKEFISSILRGIQEIQLAISFIGLSKKVKGVRPAGRSLFLNFAMNEFGIDLFRLDPKSPAHRMYFSPQDIAHQALLAAISIGVSMDDGDGKPERLLYIPMATTTVKTTLPSKTIADSTDKNAAERNANMLFANLVVTSPSLDLDLKHMAIVLALLKNRTGDPASDRGSGQNRLISRLLPKASIRISVQEPVARVVLPISDPGPKTADQYDLLISSISSISLDLESSHSSVGELHYALTSSLRISSHRFYYQAYDGERHNLLLIDALELKIQVSATPEVSVVAFGNLETLSVHMIRPEISQGVQQIFQQLRKISSPDSSTFASYTNRASFLRRMPPWLVHAQIRGSNFGFEVAGVDTGISQNIRGVALQLESWNAEYRIQKSVGYTKRQNLRRHMNNSTSGDESFRNTELPVISKPSSETMDGRRMVFHILGFETFVVEGVNHWEPEPFISIPKFETTMSTTSDQRGFIFNISTHAKALHINYSLYRYYAIGVAQGVLRRAFGLRSAGQAESRTSYNKSGAQMAPPLVTDNPVEITTIDVKVALFQVKATMPSDPPMMLQLYGMEAGHHRWAAPFLKLRMLRLYAEPPKIKSAWARILSVNNARMDLREGRKKNGDHFTSERSVDLFAEFTRLAIPHQLVIHKIFDNFVNAFKATEQLNHRFNTGTDTYILKKRPEEPKKVPRVSFRTRALMFELEDGLFDWKLGLIYRVGLNEQKQRLAREDAFRLKVKKLQEQDQRRNSSKYKSRFDSRQGRDRSNNFNHSTRRSSSPSRESHTRQRSSSPSNSRSRYIRYDAEAVSGLTGTARISAQDAWLKLQEHNAASWKKRIAYAIKYQSNAMKEIRNLFWGNDEPPEYADDSETVISIPGRPGLMSALVNDLHLIIDSPSFPVNEYPKFLHSVGKGMPYNMEYSLIIPLNLQVNLGEAKVTMRNYPLPLIHVPALKAGQSSRLPSLSLRTDFVIAEEFRDDQSLKHVRVEVVPRQKITDPPEVKNGFCIDVRRTVSPVKTYSDVDIVINTSNPTIITWGTSYQPAIQDMMQIIESFTKPQIDPSDRAGFWDKIRLIFHSRIRFTWKGDGDVHLRLKGIISFNKPFINSISDLCRFSRSLCSYWPWRWFCHVLSQQCPVGYPPRRRSKEVHDSYMR